MEMREAFGHILVELGKENSKVLVLDADVKTTTRTDIFADALPKQFFQFGIAEQNMFCAAAGLATLGFTCFPTTLAVFATRRVCDQVEISIAYPRLNVKIPGPYNGIPIGKQGATHASVDDLSIMRSMPNMVVVDPADNIELAQVMRAAVEYDGPVYFRVQRPKVPDVVDENYRFEWGKSVVLREGADLTLIGTGLMTAKVVEAADELSKKGIRARILHMPCLKPIDSEAIIAASEETRLVITVENHSVYGGLGSAVAEVLAENAPCRQYRLGFRDVFLEGASDEELFRKHQLTPIQIADKAVALLEAREDRGIRKDKLRVGGRFKKGR